MKIKELKIIGFGKWQDRHIKLADDFQLLYGDNEAGKSTIYQFIQTILFGFPDKRSQTKDYKPLNQAVYGGSLIIEHRVYGKIEIERIQTENRGKAKVRFADGSVGDEANLKQLLAPLNQELFTEIFSLQQEQLNDIKHLAEDQLQQLLLAIGVSGSQKLVAKQEKFYKKQQELYKPTGRVPELNQKLTAYQELEQLIGQKERTEENYQRKSQELQQATKELAKNQQTLQEIKNELTQLSEQSQHFSEFEKHQQLATQLTHTEQVLSTSELAELEKIYRDYQLLVEQEQHYQELKAQKLLTSQASPAYVFFIEHQVAIKELAQRQAEVETIIAKRTWLKQANQELAEEHAKLVGQLGSFEQQTIILPPEEVKDQLEKLANNEQKTVAKLEEYERAFDQTLDRQERAMMGSTGKRPRKKAIPLVLPIATVIFFLSGLLALVFKYWFLGGALALIGLMCGLVTLSYLKQPRHQASKQQLSAVRDEGEELAEKIEITQKQLKELMQEKKQYLTTYHFPKDQLVSEWLYQLPLRERFSQLELAINENQQQLIEIDQQVQSYRQDLMFMQEWLPVESAELSELYTRLTDYLERMTKKQLATSQTEQGLDNWQEPLNDTRQRQQQLVTKARGTYPTLEIKTLVDLPLIIAKQQDIQQIKTEIATLASQLSTYFDLTKQYQLSELTEKSEIALANQKNVVALIDIKQKRIQELRFELRQQEQDGTLAELYQEQAGLAEEIRHLANLWLDNRLGTVVIQDVLDVLATQQLPALLSTATAFFSQLTGGNYQKCLIEKDQLVVRTQNGDAYSLNQLSTGTRDQLYMAMRLAFIQLHSQEQLAPVIIDDGWLHYDSQRKLALFKLLTRMSQDDQIICFTSDVELKNYVEQSGFKCEVL